MERMVANNLEPFEPTHPGQIIKDEIGIPANMLTNMQRDYDIYTAKHDKSFMALLEKVKNIEAVL